MKAEIEDGGFQTRIGAESEGRGPFDPGDVEPWGEAVDGKILLDEIAQLLRRFVVMPKWSAETLALWAVHTYAFQLRDVSTYIGIESPEKRCGKTTLLGVLSELVNRPVVAANISSPAFFRVIEETWPTLLIDEADTFLQGNDELRGILNSGYSRKTAYVVRVANQTQGSKFGMRSGEGEEAREQGRSRLARFSCWCPKVMAAIGRFPDTLADRCIVIRMQRKTAQEKCERLRNLDAIRLRRQCARFVIDRTDEIRNASPDIPESLNDRAADIWEPLLALADLAGGAWPGLARKAAVDLTSNAQENGPIGALLFDLFVLFFGIERDRIFSRTLVEGLEALTDRPWAELRKGREITELWLAQRLRPYGIRPKTVWIDETCAKGYMREDFREVFQRYIPRSELKELLRETKREAEG